MLTKRHLAVLRAALQFFDEEMMPHGRHVIRHYFDETLDEELKAEEIKDLRKSLENCELRYTCIDPGGSHVNSLELSATVEDAMTITATVPHRIATVLVPTTS